MDLSSHSKIVLFREAGAYGFGMALAQVVSAIRGLVIAGILGPSAYGVWKKIQVVLDYLSYTHFGVLHGMSRKLPLARAERKGEEARITLKIGLGTALSASLVTGLILVGWNLGARANPIVLWVAAAGLLVLGQLIRFVAMRCQADGRLGVMSSAELTWALVAFAGMVALVPHLGVLGVLLGLGAGYSAALMLAWLFGIFPKWADLAVHEAPGTIWGTFKELVTTGFPFMFVDGLFVVWQRVDFVVLGFLFPAGSKELGWYGLAAMVASFAIQIPQIQMRVLFRRTLNAAALADSGPSIQPTRLQDHLELPVLNAACSTPLLFGLGTVLSCFLVQSFLPDYSPSLSSVSLLMLACYWTGIGVAARNLYTAMNRQWRLALIYCFSITVTVVTVLVLSAWRGGPDIRFGAVGMLGGAFVFGISSVVDNARACKVGLVRAFRLAFIAVGPFVPFVIWNIVRGGFTSGPAAESAWRILIWDSATCLIFNAPAAAWGAKQILGRRP